MMMVDVIFLEDEDHHENELASWLN